MLICDLVMQRKFPPELELVLGKEALDLLVADMDKAQKFILDRSLAMAADAVEIDEVERVLSAWRVPFKDVWIECLHRDRAKFWNAPLDPHERVKGFSVAVRPKRIGILLQCIDESRSRFMATLIWSFDNDHLNPGMLAMAMDLSDDPSALEALRGKYNYPTANVPKCENRAMLMPSRYWVPLIIKLQQAGKLDEAAEVVRNGHADWAHEPIFWWAVLALLNCRNVAETQTVNVLSINHARIKQGRP